MIISYSNKFVYTRPMKVGSTSVQHMIHNSNLVSESDTSLGDTDNVFEAGFLKTRNLELPESRKDAILYKLKLLHSTPKQLLELGLITQSILETYTFISIIRNPVERFLSAWVMEIIGGYFPGNSYDKFVSMLENAEFPKILDFPNPKDYLFLEDTKLPNILVLKTNSLLPNLQTQFPEVTFTEQRLKKTTYPSWLQNSYKSLDKRYLDIIKSRMADEIVFYESITGETV